jgi:hypothetical protein
MKLMEDILKGLAVGIVLWVLAAWLLAEGYYLGYQAGRASQTISKVEP